MGPPTGETEVIARDWLARAGNRWRPFLTVAAHQALRDDAEGPLSDALKKAALAVECFHKASLVHDDIEDNDAKRYGESTLHAEHGIPVALNVGDLLIGEGYRLLADSNIYPQRKAEMFMVAAEGQRELCRGQGAELIWNNAPTALSSAQVLEIFRSKTAPAFEVALKVGAALTGRLEDTADALKEYSEALGIAYQIRDDLDDLGEDSAAGNEWNMRPSIVLSLLREKGKGEVKDQMDALWNGVAKIKPDNATIREWALDSGGGVAMG